MRSVRTARPSTPGGHLPLTAILVLCGLAVGAPLFGQGMHLSVSDHSVQAGSTVVASALVDNDQEIMGFSFGLRHDAARLTPLIVDPGAAVQATNGGAGPDYFLADLNPINGPGLIVASIFTFSGPLDTIAVGVDQEAATITYSTSATAPPGTTTSVDPAGDLGDPPTVIVFSVNGVSFFPTTSSGTITFEVPAPTGVSANLVDACVCDFDVSWTNSATYDALEVRVDGALVATLPGGATSTSISLPGPSTADVCVRGIINTVESPDACAPADCPTVTPAPEPTGLTCTIATEDPVTGCTVDVAWTLGGLYTDIEVLLDGVVVEVLPGTAISTTVSIAVSPLSQQICLQAYDECGDPLAATVCCDVTCFPGDLFVRGDCNGDGGLDIADVITGLGVLFGGAGPALCDDACDNNDDGQFDISDGIYLLGNLFSGGPPPPPPHPGCGIDVTDTDALDCAGYPGC